MKKIIFNTDSLIMGGAEKLAIQYIRELCKDYQVILLINEDNGVEGNILEKDIPSKVEYKFIVDKKIMENLNKYRDLKKKNKNNLWYRFLYNYYLKQRRKSYRKNIVEILKNENYDILIDFYCKIPEEVVDSRTICWLHSNMEKVKNKEKVRKKFLKAKKIIVITDGMKQQFIHHFSELEGKVERLYNPFNIEKIKEKSLDNKILSEQEKELLKEKFILSCSRLDKNKDIQTLINAFNILKKEKNIKEKLYVAGEGPARYELELLVKKLELEKEIIFLGNQLNPYIWMKNCKLFVHSSKKEGFGMVLVEALINEAIVVATDCPVGPKEILKNGENGFLTEVGNVSKMENTIYKALTDIKVRNKMKAKGLERVKEFSEVEIYNQLKTILNN